jgi:hypothetical protein
MGPAAEKMEPLCGTHRAFLRHPSDITYWIAGWYDLPPSNRSGVCNCFSDRFEKASRSV